MAADSAARGSAATLFLIGYYEYFNLVGALNSSPWTAESFGGDPGKNASARKYVKHAAVNGALASGAGVLIGGTWWPLIGTAIAAAYTWWIYDRALHTAEVTQSVGFQSPSGRGWGMAGW